VVNEDNYLKVDQVYLGLNAESCLLDLISDPQFAKNSEKVKSMARAFYEGAIIQIKKRFPFEGEI